MGRLALSFKAFFRILSDGDFAARVGDLSAGKPLQMPAPAAAPAPLPGPAPGVTPAPAAKPAPARSEALTLLGVLQREARLVDFLNEDITPYANEQIGAAVRDVHRDARAALERMFALRPVMTEAEGASVAVPAGSDAARVRLVGNVAGGPPFRGTLRHGGWEATKVQLPEWSVGDGSARVVAPAEVEL